MASGALFSNNAVRGASKNLVELKAGRMNMKGKMVYPDTRKGLLYVYQSDDSLMHFGWKDRTSGQVEDDLIIFPDDCEFKAVPQCKTGRVYLLRFKLSNKKFFFWLQDVKTEKDDENCRKINELLNHPPTRTSSATNDGDLQNLLNNMSQTQLMQLFGGVGQMNLGNILGMRERPHNTRASTTSSSSSTTPLTTSATRPPAAQTPAPGTDSDSPRSSSATGTPKNSATAAPTTTPSNLLENLSSEFANSSGNSFDLQRHLWNFTAPPGTDPAAVQRNVATELTNTMSSAITSTDSLESTMTTHLPPGDTLSTTLSSPQFSQALSMFWSALQSGQAGPVVRQFGLGTDAINAAATGNLEDFVSALETETKSSSSTTSSSATTAAAAAVTADDDKNKDKPTAAAAADKKKDDEDDGMALD